MLLLLLLLAFWARRCIGPEDDGRPVSQDHSKARGWRGWQTSGTVSSSSSNSFGGDIHGGRSRIGGSRRRRRRRRRGHWSDGWHGGFPQSSPIGAARNFLSARAHPHTFSFLRDGGQHGMLLRLK